VVHAVAVWWSGHESDTAVAELKAAPEPGGQRGRVASTYIEPIPNRNRVGLPFAHEDARPPQQGNATSGSETEGRPPPHFPRLLIQRHQALVESRHVCRIHETDDLLVAVKLQLRAPENAAIRQVEFVQTTLRGRHEETSRRDSHIWHPRKLAHRRLERKRPPNLTLQRQRVDTGRTSDVEPALAVS